MSLIQFCKFAALFLPSLLFALPGAVLDGPSWFWNNYILYNTDPITVHQNADDDSVVVFVHGRNGHDSSFYGTINGLKKLGVNKTLVTVYLGPTGKTSVVEDTNTLCNSLKQIGAKKVILVGLSKGGLTVSNYVATYGTTNVSAVITISSPLSGTLTASYLMKPIEWVLGPHIARTELGYQSDFTIDLEERLPADIPFFHVVPTWDHLVIPTSSASIKGPNHTSRVFDEKYYNHLNIQSSPRVLKWISEIIAVH